MSAFSIPNVCHTYVSKLTDAPCVKERNVTMLLYIICTKVAPHITTTIQKAKMEFRKRYKDNDDAMRYYFEVTD